MKNTMKLKLLAAAVMMVAGTAHAGVGVLNGTLLASDGSTGNAYDYGAVGATPSVLFVSLTDLSASTYFEEHANFTVASSGNGSGVGNTHTLTFAGVDILDIDGLTINVWDNVHPNGLSNLATFSGNNVTTSLGLLAAGHPADGR